MRTISNRWIGALGVAALGASLALATPAAQAETAAAAGLRLSYDFTQGTGASVPDASGNGLAATIVGDGVRAAQGLVFDGTGDYVDLPDNVMTGLNSITISTEVLLDATQGTPFFIWGLGNTNPADANRGNGYVFATGNAYRAGIASGNWTTEQTAGQSANLTRGVWHTLTYTLDDATDTARLYLDGTQVAVNTTTTITPGSIGGGVTTSNWIGRSNYFGDATLKGTVRTFDIWDAALTATEVADLVPDDADKLARDVAALTLGNTGAVTANLTLPTTGVSGSTITWASSAPGVVSTAGVVTRPAADQPDATVTLTATLTRGSLSQTRAFTVTVLSNLDANGRAQADLDAVGIVGADDVRGNITLPMTGEQYDSAITWTASPTGVITTSAAGGKAAGVVTRGATDTVVTLTGTVAGTTATRSLPVTVTAAPVDLDDDYSAGYLWTHFATQGGYEKIFQGYSENGLQWEKLNENQPILANLGGDLGVRDPHLVRSPGGDKYWIIGTDLHAEGGGAGGSGWDQLNASQNIVVWESTDLVNWSDQRIVHAGFDFAGCVWAPEATYNAATGEYYVYWSARDQRENTTNDWALRVYLTKTRDFVTFTEPQVWANLNTQGDGATGPNIIDSTIAVENGIYYRFSTSDWNTIVDTATSLDGPWTTVIARGEAAAHGLRARMEGLTVFKLPNGNWALYGDDGGYFGHTAPTWPALPSSS